MIKKNQIEFVRLNKLPIFAVLFEKGLLFLSIAISFS